MVPDEFEQAPPEDQPHPGVAAEAAAEPELKAEEYKVGWGKPPLHSRFKEGVSGCPAGRPKGQPNLATLLKRRLYGRVQIKEEGRRKRVTRLEAIVAQATNEALQGRGKGFERVVLLMRGAGMLTEDAGPTKPAPLSAAEQAIIDEFLAGQKRYRS